MSQAKPFTLEKRERFLASLERGSNRKEAAATADVSVRTVTNWLTRGRRANDDSDESVFARRFDQILAGDGPVELTKPDLVKLLEAEARKGRTIAILALLNKPWEKGENPEPAETRPVKSFAEKLAEKRKGKK